MKPQEILFASAVIAAVAGVGAALATRAFEAKPARMDADVRGLERTVAPPGAATTETARGLDDLRMENATLKERMASLEARLAEALNLPPAFELLSRSCVDAVLAHRPGVRDPLPGSAWSILVELGDSGTSEALHERLEQALDTPFARDAVVAKNAAESKALWGIRETVPEAQFSNVKHDISVPVSKVPDLIARLGASLERAFPGKHIYCFGHVGDGNLHYNVGSAALVARRDEVSRIVYDALDALGGSISAEHGLGQMKRAEIRARKHPLEMELMRTLKQALDPRGLMNPGKVL